MKRSGTRVWLTGLGLCLMLFLYSPLWMIFVGSFNSAPRGGAWQGFTLHWYQSLFHDEIVLSAARVTLWLGLLSTIVATVLGTCLALGLKTPVPGRRILNTSLLFPVVTPDVIMAIALLLLFHEMRNVAGWPDPGFLTMLLAHITFQIPFVTLVVQARLTGFDPSLEDAAHDLGANRWQTFWHVKFPFLRPGILGGALLALTLSLDDFVVSFFTTGPGATTLPIYIYSSVKRGITPEINAISTLLIVAAVLGTTCLTLLGTSRKAPNQ